MTNNDILRRLRYTFNFNDAKMADIFESGGLKVTPKQVIAWLKKDEDPLFEECIDTQLAIFLNGLINERRGKREGQQPTPEKRLNNNIILTKLKIALNLKAEDIVDLMRETNLPINKAELSAFFRKRDHKNYRPCHDQFLRNFIKGVELKFFVTRPAKYITSKDKEQNLSKPNKNKAASNHKPAKASNKVVYHNPNATKKRDVLSVKPKKD
ncbi:DUF1456 family protein [Aliikangiella sp. IMCC44653]